MAPGVRAISTLPALLDDFALQYRPIGRPPPESGVLAWGRRPSALRAQRYAQRQGVPVYHIEDGFLRSVGLGQDDPPLSICFDDLGLYLDASQPSRLESLIRRPILADQVARAEALVRAWREGRVSKYNHSRDPAQVLPDPFVLVVDQTQGDASIDAGLASAATFDLMLEAALREHPDAAVIVKTHPDVLAGRKQGYFDPGRLAGLTRVSIMAEDVHPAGLLESARQVYTVTSQLGFEALIWGVPVRVFGMPFYAGWGLTRDEIPAPPRRGGAGITLEQLVYATLIDYCRYVDPESGKRCEVETVLAWLALQRRMLGRFAPTVIAIGISRWKRRYLREFFAGSTVKFQQHLPPSLPGTVATWGCKLDRHLEQGDDTGADLIRVEDGFIRSVGLGADLTRPLSWVQDDLGIYYDATRTSRLEILLRQTRFTPELRARAERLRETIVAGGFTKYNLASQHVWRRPAVKRVLLVVGQVETDASIRFGAASLRTNMALLRTVRQANSRAHIVYKPHPDVLAGLRKAGQGEGAARQWCDEIIGDVAFGRLLADVDEVHVLTSLAGFEALLRGKPVVTYGQPFYAGWGLTRDTALKDEVRRRRGRQLHLDELVAATLILYPTYVSWVTGRFSTPETIVRELAQWPASLRVPRWRHWIARLFREA